MSHIILMAPDLSNGDGNMHFHSKNNLTKKLITNRKQRSKMSWRKWTRVCDEKKLTRMFETCLNVFLNDNNDAEAKKNFDKKWWNILEGGRQCWWPNKVKRVTTIRIISNSSITNIMRLSICNRYITIRTVKIYAVKYSFGT